MTTIPASMILKRDVLGRVTVTPARREELLDEFERSGLKALPFSKLVGVNYQTFASWIQKRRRERGGYSPAPHAAPSENIHAEQCAPLPCSDEAQGSESAQSDAALLVAQSIAADESSAGSPHQHLSQDLPIPSSTPVPLVRTGKSAPIRRAMDMRFVEISPPLHSPPLHPPPLHHLQAHDRQPMEVELPGGARLLLRAADHVELAVKLISALRTSC